MIFAIACSLTHPLGQYPSDEIASAGAGESRIAKEYTLTGIAANGVSVLRCTNRILIDGKVVPQTSAALGSHSYRHILLTMHRFSLS